MAIFLFCVEFRRAPSWRLAEAIFTNEKYSVIVSRKAGFRADRGWRRGTKGYTYSCNV